MSHTFDYYETNAKSYYKQTCNIDPTPFLTVVTKRLSPGAKILDVGCGSGRDILWLKQKGYHVQGLERAPHMAELATIHSGCQVIVADFETYNFSDLECDAILLVGSLVHLPHLKLPAVLKRILDGLNKDGYMYLSLKQGKATSVTHQGRTFSLWQRNQLEAVFSDVGLQPVHFSKNISPIYPSDVWLGYLLSRKT
ncbi:class I SAM-dependent methyltransferase [Desulfogranum marinum]|jgi:SAM-dependent methyltransferase|uniref:class I SAM-dependent methyltransferase n=1 Tax=Desulfogranum marinum TaxID=453220 RepID=UPI0029C8430B|nr:class I SAM-dependent methyltransferase [Desulfogranum marinum]